MKYGAAKKRGVFRPIFLQFFSHFGPTFLNHIPPQPSTTHILCAMPVISSFPPHFAQPPPHFPPFPHFPTRLPPNSWVGELVSSRAVSADACKDSVAGVCSVKAVGHRGGKGQRGPDHQGPRSSGNAWPGGVAAGARSLGRSPGTSELGLRICGDWGPGRGMEGYCTHTPATPHKCTGRWWSSTICQQGAPGGVSWEVASTGVDKCASRIWTRSPAPSPLNPPPPWSCGQNCKSPPPQSKGPHALPLSALHFWSEAESDHCQSRCAVAVSAALARHGTHCEGHTRGGQRPPWQAPSPRNADGVAFLAGVRLVATPEPCPDPGTAAASPSSIACTLGADLTIKLPIKTGSVQTPSQNQMNTTNVGSFGGLLGKQQS